MPRWNFEIMAGTLSREDKDQIAKQVTKIIQIWAFPHSGSTSSSMRTKHAVSTPGGKSPAPAAWFGITHAARQFESEEERSWFHRSVDEIVRPVFEPKGIKQGKKH